MCCGLCTEGAKVQPIMHFLMEITLLYCEFVKYPPSAIALAALTLGCYLCGKGRCLFNEMLECLEIVDLLYNQLAKHVNKLSEILIKKHSYVFYSKAPTFVVQYYLEGGCFHRWALTSLYIVPVTPNRSNTSAFNTPMSKLTSGSDYSDDYPLTPMSPQSFLSSDHHL